jgi:hypothetical protein
MSLWSYPVQANTVRYDSRGREVVQATSAFAEQISAQLYPQWQQSFEYTVDNTDLNENIISGSASVTQANALAVISTGTTTGSESRLKSTHHARYRAGLGGVARLSAKYTTPVAGTFQYAGLVDEHGAVAEFVNGYAVGFNGATATVARFQNDVLFEVTQANWDDPLDGTGESGITMDFTKLNVFYIQFQYLGAGPIYFWTEDPDTGVPFRFHTIKYGNTNTTPSTYNPNYHMTFYADNGATTSDMIVSTASYGYFIEGQTELIEVHQPQFSSEQLSKAAVTTETAIFTIRNKATYPTASPKVNYIDILLEHISASLEVAAAANIGQVRLIKNATLGGTPAYADINATNSVVEIDVAGTTVTGGRTLFVLDLAGKNAANLADVLPYKFIVHPGETITAAGTSASAATIKSLLLWKELF